MSQPSTSIKDDIWLLNGYTSVSEEGQNFFITYISRPNSWHRLNVVVKRSRATDSPRQTIDTKIATATAAWPEDGCQMIYVCVRGLLEEATYGNIITRLVIGNDGCGKIAFHSRPDKKELARLSSLNDQGIQWQVPVVKDIVYAKHDGGYNSKVHCEHKCYTFKQTADLDMLDDSLYELRVLNSTVSCPNSTVSCPYMSNLAYVVYDESEQNIRGYLLDEHTYRESLHAVWKCCYERGSPIPWYVRRRWTIQIVSAVHSLHGAGFVHGGLTLKTISLVPGTGFPMVTVAASTILVACPRMTSQTPSPGVYMSTELLTRHNDIPGRPYFTVQSDIYTLNCGPDSYEQSRGKLNMSFGHDSEPDVSSWGFPVRQAIQDCLSAQSSHRPSTDSLLRVLKEDALKDDIDPQPLDAIADLT